MAGCYITPTLLVRADDTELETEVLDDALDELARIMGALLKRRGDAFRDLERRAEAFIEDGSGWTAAYEDVIAPLDDGRGVLLVPPPLRSVIDQARSLGV